MWLFNRGFPALFSRNFKPPQIYSTEVKIASAKSQLLSFDPQSAKYDFRVFLLHLGLIGDEFKTARKHLMANMPGDAAFKNGRPKPEDVLPDETETTTLTNEAGQVPGLTV